MDRILTIIAHRRKLALGFGLSIALMLFAAVLIATGPDRAKPAASAAAASVELVLKTHISAAAMEDDDELLLVNRDMERSNHRLFHHFHLLVSVAIEFEPSHVTHVFAPETQSPGIVSIAVSARPRAPPAAGSSILS